LSPNVEAAFAFFGEQLLLRVDECPDEEVTGLVSLLNLPLEAGLDAGQDRREADLEPPAVALGDRGVQKREDDPQDD
jgi:hypothetical protein